MVGGMWAAEWDGLGSLMAVGGRRWVGALLLVFKWSERGL